MWLLNALEDVLSSQGKVALLRVLAHSTVPLNGREIARRAQRDPGYTSRTLRELAASGVVVQRDQGRVKTYELADPGLELVGQLRELFTAEERRYAEVVSALSDSLPGVLAVILFGSEARGEAQPGSDTDLLVVVERKTSALESRLRTACLQIAEQHGLALSWHVADLKDLRRWDKTGHELWRSILRDGVKLSGQSLETLRREWLHGKAS
jgi:predicted nucleotidyltransferase